MVPKLIKSIKDISEFQQHLPGIHWQRRGLEITHALSSQTFQSDRCYNKQPSPIIRGTSKLGKLVGV